MGRKIEISSGLLVDINKLVFPCALQLKGKVDATNTLKLLSHNVQRVAVYVHYPLMLTKTKMDISKALGTKCLTNLSFLKKIYDKEKHMFCTYMYGLN